MSELKDNPIISIVLPVFNGEKYLPEAIESVLNQSFAGWELIIIDDCSTDKTPEIIRTYTDKDTRIVSFRNSTNSKLPASLNNGFEHARGKYYTWTSDDNRFKENALEQLKQCLDTNPSIDFVYSDYERIGETGESLNEVSFPGPEKLPIQNTVGACFLYRRELAQCVGKYDENLYLIEDYDYWLRCLLNGKLRHLPLVLYEYRVHGNSLTNKRKREITVKQSELRGKYYHQLYNKVVGTKEMAAYLYTSRKLKVQEAPSLSRALISCPGFFPYLLKRTFIWPIKGMVRKVIETIFPGFRNRKVKY